MSAKDSDTDKISDLVRKIGSSVGETKWDAIAELDTRWDAALARLAALESSNQSRGGKATVVGSTQLIATMVPRAVLIEALGALLARSTGYSWPLPQSVDPVGPKMESERASKRTNYAESIERIIREQDTDNYHASLVLDFAQRFGLASSTEKPSPPPEQCTTCGEPRDTTLQFCSNAFHIKPTEAEELVAKFRKAVGHLPARPWKVTDGGFSVDEANYDGPVGDPNLAKCRWEVVADFLSLCGNELEHLLALIPIEPPSPPPEPAKEGSRCPRCYTPPTETLKCFSATCGCECHGHGGWTTLGELKPNEWFQDSVGNVAQVGPYFTNESSKTVLVPGVTPVFMPYKTKVRRLLIVRDNEITIEAMARELLKLASESASCAHGTMELCTSQARRILESLRGAK